MFILRLNIIILVFVLYLFYYKMNSITDLKHTIIVLLLISYIVIRPNFVSNLRSNIFNDKISELLLLLIGIVVGWLIMTQYSESVGYLFIAAFIIFAIGSKKDNFSNAGLVWRDLRDLDFAMKDKKNMIPEQVLDYKNLPYQKYVDESDEVYESKNNIDNVNSEDVNPELLMENVE